MINHNILPIIHNINNTPSKNMDNITDGIIKGQIISANNQLFINQTNISNFSIWNLIQENIIFKTGKSFFLGNNIPQIIYHELNKEPVFFNLTLLEDNKDNIGDTFITYLDNTKIAICNNGTDTCRFCWFII